MKAIKFNALYVLVVCLILFGGFACDSTDRYLGVYKSIEVTEEIHREIFIELMENGEGAWICCDGEVSFTWYVKNNELRINTKEGGIMVGKLKNKSFTITLPGKKKLIFVKTPLQG
ncbi:MAG: hypothetical protein HF978_20190 [Desulfobacteraceae bacterium]|nr:hypothetical protein [Desulfobacteraceae bacterium]MBC2757868.1 hypothetical protein [Desulfobacteraceae bacterium]